MRAGLGMFSKILIANRGEIACRIIRTAKAMGCKTVAVFSDADRDAMHVRMADEAIEIGPSPSAQSYLRTDKILAAMEETSAKAVHPGYGFLSENAAFAKAVAEKGWTFIGPGPDAIASMGDKVQSKEIARRAGVHVIPGKIAVLKSDDEAVALSRDIGYPVMLKAAAGGGGKGMRIARNDDDVRRAFRSAASEAKSSFGDDRLFIEKFIENPRHIEIQIMADTHGNVIYLGERECSIQRRHQKVIEEAPSPFATADLRSRMGAQSVLLAKAVDYVGAGTVEFVVDRDRNFYFLEMNTRLQVEHPVTEMVTGCDLVEEMIRVAAGEKLRMRQKDVAIKGWAIEARIYAEDPSRGFLPSTGRLVSCRLPVKGNQSSTPLRVDTGVEEGSEISMYYDPMVAKLCAYGDGRDQALDRMAAALDRFYLRGISHNIPFLADLVRNKNFRKGDFTTAFLDNHYTDGYRPPTSRAGDRFWFLAAICLVHRTVVGNETSISGQLPGHEARVPPEWVVCQGDKRDTVTIVPASSSSSPSAVSSSSSSSSSPSAVSSSSPSASSFADPHSVDARNDHGASIGADMKHSVDARSMGANMKHSSKAPFEWRITCGEKSFTLLARWQPGQRLLACTIDEKTRYFQVERRGVYYRLTSGGCVFDAMLLRPNVAGLLSLMPVRKAVDLSRYLLSPMPGLLVSVAVREGQRVVAGEELAVVEAMKMENVLCAAKDGVVEKIECKPGDSLVVDQKILQFKAT